MQQAEIIAVGSELLMGGRVDTNALFLTEGLALAGIEVRFKSVVGDEEADIVEAIRTASGRVKVIVLTGGLGPTLDDRTRQAVARATRRPLRRRAEAFEGMRRRLAVWGRTLTRAQLRQVLIPSGAEVLPNPVGSAPGFYLKWKGCVLVALPGVPSEAKQMFAVAVAPKLAREAAARGRQGRIARRMLQTFGLAESDLDLRLKGLVRPETPRSSSWRGESRGRCGDGQRHTSAKSCRSGAQRHRDRRPRRRHSPEAGRVSLCWLERRKEQPVQSNPRVSISWRSPLHQATGVASRVGAVAAMVGQAWVPRTIMIRTFVAVELDEELRKALAMAQGQVQEQLMKQVRHSAPGVRVQWVRPDSIHLTLKFLGDIDETLVQDIRAALLLAVQTQPRFAVEVGGLGVFPDLRAPRVLWTGLFGQVDALMRLAAEVEAALTGVGFPPESRPLSPHLTLARIKERSREVGRGLADSGLMRQPVRVGSLAVHSVCLMKSDLKPSGAVYTRLCEVPLC